jgi:hypothetical protein
VKRITVSEFARIWPEYVKRHREIVRRHLAAIAADDMLMNSLPFIDDQEQHPNADAARPPHVARGEKENR